VNTLHITNGDSVRTTLREIVADPIAIVADPLHEGPAPAGIEGREWLELRARFLAGPHAEMYDDVLRWLTQWDQGIADASRYDEVVLWFEHDLFDQLGLIRVLDRLIPLNSDAAARVFLICIGNFPGVDRFVGLGQLTAEQLATLPDRRQPVTAAQFAIAQRLWAAFRDADPTNLMKLKSDPATQAAFPFMPAALERFFQEYPSTVNGLSRTADAIVQALSREPLGGYELFVRTQTAEPAPFMGDLMLYHIVDRMTAQSTPLVAVEKHGAGPFDEDALRRARISITTAGRAVADGRQDAVVLNGIDEWRGGVHLRGTDRSPWRWDPSAETLIS